MILKAGTYTREPERSLEPPCDPDYIFCQECGNEIWAYEEAYDIEKHDNRTGKDKTQTVCGHCMRHSDDVLTDEEYADMRHVKHKTVEKILKGE